MVIPYGIKVGQRCISVRTNRTTVYKWGTLLFTFFIYCSYHISRKPISVIKSVLRPDNCSILIQNDSFPIQSSLSGASNQTIYCGWAPFDRAGGKSMLGALDTSFLFPYAIGMFVSGHIAERVNLRYFLSSGMILSALFTALFGMGFFWEIHNVTYYIVMQACAGFVQASGWPSVVTCVANWFGKGRRGLIMGLWNSHTSFGNILGSVIAGYFADENWGLSFIVPASIIGGLGILVFLFLVPAPADVNCELPDHKGARHLLDGDPERQYSRTVAVHNIEEDFDDVVYAPIPHVQEAAPLLDSSDGEDAPVSQETKAISFVAALRIPGVIEFSLCLFFAKLVSYVFLFWLPDYISSKLQYNAELSADLSTVFDFGGIIGGVFAGVVSDATGGRATTCMVMLVLAAPTLYIYNTFTTMSVMKNIGLLLGLGALVNGPYALITTAVSADLGTHQSLKGNSKALATVTAIIDGTGSIGAAVGPQLAGLIHDWQDVFYMLIAADVVAMLLLVRLVVKELLPLCRKSKCCTDRERLSNE